MATGTVRLHRVLRASPERLYRAFLDADAMAKWLPPYGFTCRVHAMDARVGGTFRMSFINFSTGHGHSFGGEYLELVPHERIRYTDRFDDPNLPGEMQVTVSLKQVSCGSSAGKNRSRNLPRWSSPIFRVSAVTPARLRKATDRQHPREAVAA